MDRPVEEWSTALDGAVTQAMERFDKTDRHIWKAVLADGQCILCAVFVTQTGPHHFQLGIDPAPFEWMQNTIVWEPGPHNTLDFLAETYGHARAAGEEVNMPEHEDDPDAIFAGLCIVLGEAYKHTCDDPLCEREILHDDRENIHTAPDKPKPGTISDTCYIALRDGNMYTRRYMGTPRARQFHDYLNPSLSTEEVVELLKKDPGSVTMMHMTLINLLHAMLAPPDVLKKSYEPKGFHQMRTDLVAEMISDFFSSGALPPDSPFHPSRKN